MDACDGLVIGGGVSAFARAFTPLLDTLIEQLVREQPSVPANPLFFLSPWIGTNEAAPP
jgi:hypothetical protein